MNKKALLTTMYKNNIGLIAKTKVRKYKKGLCLTEKILRKNPLLFLYETVKSSLLNHEKNSNLNIATCFM